jgi:hypothetical protein
MALEDFLLPGEKVLSSFDEVYLTNERVIQYSDSSLESESIKDIHYMFLESVEYSEVAKPVYLIASILLSLIGLGVYAITKEINHLFFFLFVGAVLFLLFIILKDRHTLFRGTNSVIKIKKKGKELIVHARRLQRDYLLNPANRTY